MLEVIEHEIDSIAVVDAVRKLADNIEASSTLDASVVCIIRIDKEVRLYAIGDDLAQLIANASSFLDGANQSLAVQNRSVN